MFRLTEIDGSIVKSVHFEVTYSLVQRGTVGTQERDNEKDSAIIAKQITRTTPNTFRLLMRSREITVQVFVFCLFVCFIAFNSSS